VDRLLELVAPADESLPPLDLARIAVLTFTRKAAGELRFRVRQALLERLGGAEPSAPRSQRLRDALEKLDAAFVGTIDSFADRLLRLRPIEARLSPRYRIAENPAALVRETFDLLVRSAEQGHLPGAVQPALRQRAAEAEATLRDYERAGLLMETRLSPLGFGMQTGLDHLIRQFIDKRDLLANVPGAGAPGRPAAGPPESAPDLRPVHSVLADHIQRVENRVRGEDRGSQWLLARARDLREAVEANDPIEVLRIVQSTLDRKPRDMTKKDDFLGDEISWSIWKEFWGDDKPLEGGIGDAVRPLHDWMGRRLLGVGPIVIDLYDAIKERHEVVDFLDLLLRLRELLRQPDLQRFYSSLFDHLFIDEFQDTDPLQVEILFLLAHDAGGRDAGSGCATIPAPGRLTIVGDPQQSIYRFRRADILIYRDACRKLEGARLETLDVNFRSRPALIRFFNDRLVDVLGQHPLNKQERFDAEGCTAYYHELQAHEEEDTPDAVHRLVYSVPDRRGYAGLEADALARHLCWLVRGARLQVRDPGTGRPRPVTFGDIAVLARATTHLPQLFDQLDRFGIPYAARGGNVFLRQPVVRQFILGLRALSDRRDGAAQAALLAPPFFALDYGEVIADGAAHREARQIIDDLQRRRTSRPPAATALDLLERTAFGRQVALTPNGERRLAAVGELIGQIDLLAHEERLGFDGVTAELRSWLTESDRRLEQAAPVDAAAVQVLTTHQAKGLEFPVVALWDANDKLAESEVRDVWVVSRAAGTWRIKLSNFLATSPGGDTVAEDERRFYNAERRRLIYVAATRARDVLVIPDARTVKDRQPADPEKYCCAALLGDGTLAGAAEHEPWPEAQVVAEFPQLIVDEAADERAARLETDWAVAGVRARRPLARPRFMTIQARRSLAAQGPPFQPGAGTQPAGRVESSAAAGAAPELREPALPSGRQMQFEFGFHAKSDRDAPESAAAALAGRPPDGTKDGAVAGPADGSPAAEDSTPGSGDASAGATLAGGFSESAPASELPPLDESSRHGAEFGTAVHQALQWILAGRPEDRALLVERACRLAGGAAAGPLSAAVREDTERALSALRGEGIRTDCGGVLYPEYPVHLHRPDEGLVLRGSIDLVAVLSDRAWIIDFKTDQPAPLEHLPHYVRQVQLYAEALQATGLLGSREWRAGLLFTADGTFRWIR
jgi:ATP-dependent helicase/nuclease subunit A